MMKINEEMNYLENSEKNDNFKEETQNEFEFYNPNYNVNYFGLGRGSEDWQWEYKIIELKHIESSLNVL